MTAKKINKIEKDLKKIHYEIQNKSDDIRFEYKSKSKKLDVYETRLLSMHEDLRDGEYIPKRERKNLIKQIRRL